MITLFLVDVILRLLKAVDFVGNVVNVVVVTFMLSLGTLYLAEVNRY